MSTTSKASESHDHPVQGKRTGPGGMAHTHQSDIEAAIAAHEAAHHATEPPTTEPPPVEPPPDAKPVISGVAVSAVTSTGARISWSLSEPCTGQIEYGKSNTYGTLSPKESGLLPSHSQVLAGLTADTTYHFRIHSVDAGGQEVTTADASFKTAADVVVTPPPVTPPPARTITVATGTRGYTAKAGEVIDGWQVTGPGDATFDYSTVGIYVNAPNVTIRNCRISGVGFCGILLGPLATGFLIEKNDIGHCCYAGIMGLGITNFQILANTIHHIGDHGHHGTGNDCNAYGIVPTMDTGGPPSADGLIDGNTVTDIPLWHGLDTHGGQRLKFSNNIIRRTARAIFITSQSETEVPRDVSVIGNDLGEPQTRQPVEGTDANSAITLYKSLNTIVDNNKTGTYPTQINNIGTMSTFAHPPTGNHA